MLSSLAGLKSCFVSRQSGRMCSSRYGPLTGTQIGQKCQVSSLARQRHPGNGQSCWLESLLV